MSEEERFDSEETENDVEAHRRRAMMNDDASEKSEEDESDDVEAHRRRA
jgi:hypothetical protein